MIRNNKSRRERKLLVETMSKYYVEIGVDAGDYYSIKDSQRIIKPVIKSA